MSETETPKERPVERLRQFALWAKANGYVKGENSFERACGLSTRYITNSILGGRSGDMTTAIIARVYNKFPMLNLVWLVTGKGEMINTCQEVTMMDYKAAYEAATTQIVALNRIIAAYQDRDTAAANTNTSNPCVIPK